MVTKTGTDIKDIDKLCVNTIRFLSVDQVEKARSGHPGMPLGAAPMAYCLWDRFLRFNPKKPMWFDRDRFVLSAGHGSALLYSLLHLYGHDLPMEELKNFRQWGSKTPGHPEHGLTPGVEATTGPLGQGFANGVGMAIAEEFLAGCFNTETRVIDHYTYAICSDGDLMEGISSEAASLAGHLHLGKLIYLYDDNHISIEGDTDLAFSENIRERFQAYGWHCQRVEDGNDLDAIEEAIRNAQTETHQPSLIIVRTHIGYASPKQDTGSVHGEPLGEDNVRETKRALGWPEDKTFYVPREVLEHCRRKVKDGEELEKGWRERLDDYRKEDPAMGDNLERVMKGDLPEGWDSEVPVFDPADGKLATRKASGEVLNALARKLPHQIMGGSADLAPSTKTILMGYGDFGFGQVCSHNLHFGVREHAMGAIANGMALHGGAIPYTATFLIFSDYMRPALRLAALTGVHVVFVFTHDSIGLGEDGPTHQPVEHLMSLRAMPGMSLIRPADANETAAAWKVAIARDGPVAMALTRQGLPILDADRHPISEGVRRGAYVLREAETCEPQIVLIATGSEVHLGLEARGVLERDGIGTRVVSIPSWEIFEEQDAGYREQVLPPEIPKLSVEAGASLGWCRYADDSIGIDRFGASAPGGTVMKELGFNVDNVVRRALALLGRE